MIIENQLSGLNVSVALSPAELLYAKWCTLPWKTWNIENRRMLLILLPNTMQPVNYGIAGVVVLNHEFLLAVRSITYIDLALLIGV
nr:unnamed protein product [Callosobruchus chinensis]